MQYADLMETIRNSDSTDWLYNDPKRVYTYRHDVDIRVEVRDALEHQRSFTAEWANKHPDPSAYRQHYDIYYRASIVESFMLVGVDGARAFLPLPEPGTTTVPPNSYELARCVDDQNTLDEYIERSGLTVASG